MNTSALRFLTAVFLTSSVTIFAQQYQISTAAGAPPLGSPPVAATSVNLGFITSLAGDSSGNLYFTDIISITGRNEQSILRLGPDGKLVRIAGLPEQGFSGDGGPALSAEFDSNGGLAVDQAGNLYLADTFNNRIRKISSGGVITTIAGIGPSGPGSDSGDGGPALNASLNSPYLLTLDAPGNLFIGETGRLREITTDGVIHTVAGGVYGFLGDGGPAQAAQIGSIGGIAIDTAGNLYFADNFSNADDWYVPSYARIRKITLDGTITTIAGGPEGTSSQGDGGPASAATFTVAGPLALDSSGNLFIVDGNFIAGTGAVREINSSGTISTVQVNGSPLTASTIAVDSAGNLYLTDAFDPDAATTQRVRKLSNGALTLAAGTGGTCCGGSPGPTIGDGGPAAQATFNTPTSVAADHSGNLYIADTDAGLIRKVDSSGTVSTIAGLGSAGPVIDNIAATAAYLFYPTGLLVDNSGNLYFADCGDARIRVISPTGVITTVAGTGTAGRPGYSGDGGPAIQAQLSWPKDIAFDGTGSLYIADAGNSRIRKVGANGIIATIAGDGIAGFSGDHGPAIAANLNIPSGIAVDSSGDIFIADTGNFRIRKITLDGTITTIAGTGTQGFSGDGGSAIEAQLAGPLGIKLDAAGNLYVADGTAVRMISPAGIIHTIAGTGMPAFSGDGGPATSAGLTNWGLGFDGAGDLYVTDPLNDVVRVLKP